jgi:hypothetical protein
MGGGLAVFKLINPNKEKFMKGYNLSPQHTFSDFDLSDSLDNPSKLKFRNYFAQDYRISYSATHYSEKLNYKLDFSVFWMCNL